MYMNTRSMPPARGPKRFFANAHKAHGVHGAPRFHPSPCHALAPVHRGDATRTRQHVPLRLLHRHCSGRGRAQTLSKPTWLGQVGRALFGDDAAHAAAREPGVARGGRRGAGAPTCVSGGGESRGRLSSVLCFLPARRERTRTMCRPCREEERRRVVGRALAIGQVMAGTAGTQSLPGHSDQLDQVP
jgi:hypothetical protein